MTDKDYLDAERWLARSKELRLKSLHEHLDAVFSENPESHVLSALFHYSKSIKKTKWNNALFLEYVNSLEDEEVFIVRKDQLLSLLLLDNKKENAKEIDKNFVLILKFLCAEIALADLNDSLSNFDEEQLQFLNNYSSPDNVYGPSVTKNLINQFVELASGYKLNDHQKNKVYESLIDGEDYSIGEILTLEEPEIVCEIKVED